MPPVVIQRIGVLIVLTVLGAGIAGVGDGSILLAALGAGMTFAMLGGSYERARHEMMKVLSPEPPPEDPNRPPTKS